MITALVQFQLAEGATLEDVTTIYERTTHRYLGMPGLIRKTYLFDPETRVGGACYLFTSRAAAKEVFNDEWHALLRQNYNAEPKVQFFETPYVVDNVTDEIVTG